MPDTRAPLAWAHEHEGLPARTRALLIGASQYSDQSDLPDLASVPATVTDLRDVLVRRCGVDPGDVTGPLLDPATQADIGRALVTCTETPADVLLIYYCGHGLIGTDSQLYLSASQTVRDGASLGFTAFPYEQLRQSLAGCQARNIVIILDCCFAGRAADLAEGTLSSLAAPGAAAGAYLLASAAYSEAALAPEGELYTAFGGSLIRLLEDGIPDGPRLITLNEAYKALDRTLSNQGRPRPRSRSSGSAGDLVLAANPGYQPPRTLQPLIPAGTGDHGAPYRGLAAYEEADARLFFGRETLLTKLREELTSQLEVPGPLVVLGSSGSGKSSLLRAGLRPGLDHGLPGAPQVRTWPKIIITPGGDPIGALADQLASLLAADAGALRNRLDRPGGLGAVAREVVRRHAGAGAPEAGRLVIIADQFEDVFGPEVGRAQREAFLAAMDATTAPQSDGTPPAVLAVVGLRADFYGRAQTESFLAGALDRKRTFDISAMTSEELRDVITKPAAAASLAVEPELVQRVLADLQTDDLGSGAGYDTRLPLLSHALLATWRYREGTSLTLRGYQAAGGVSGAVARSAGELWTADGPDRHGAPNGSRPRLSEEERGMARRMLLQMVSVGAEGTEVARRRVPLQDLADACGAGPGNTERALAASRILGKLVSARLVSVDRDHAEIIHDSLLRTWPQLQQWIKDDRAYLATGQEANQAAAEWDQHGRRRADLYRGSRLDLARQWESATGQISVLTAEFLHRSARAAGARRIAWIAVFIALSVALTSVAILFGVSQKDADTLRARQDVLASDEIASSANTLESTNPELARELALSAYHLSPTDNAAQALAQASVTPAATEIHIKGARYGDVQALYSPDSKMLAVSDETGVSFWMNAGSGRPVQAGALPFKKVCPGSGGIPTSSARLAFAPGTRLLVTSCGQDIVWNVAHPDHPVKVTWSGASSADTFAMAISPDKHWLAVGYAGELQLWDNADPSQPAITEPVSVPSSGAQQISFSADSHLLAVATTNKQVRVAELRDNSPPVWIAAVPGTREADLAAFSPRGHLLATQDVHGDLALFDMANPGHPRKLPVPQAYKGQSVDSLSFGPDGQAIALGNDGGNVEIGPAETGASSSPYTLPSSGDMDSTAFSPDGRYLASASDNGTVYVWGVTAHPVGVSDAGIPDQEAEITGQELSPDGQLMLAPRGRGWAVWNIHDPGQPVLDSVFGDGWSQAAFTGNPRVLMTMKANSTKLQLWNLSNLRAPLPVGRPLHSPGGLVPDPSPFSPLLAIGDSKANSVTIWDISNPARPVKRATVAAGQINSASGPVFISASVLGVPNVSNIVLWNLGLRATPRRIGSRAMGPPVSEVADPGSCPRLIGPSPGGGSGFQAWDIANPNAPVAGRAITGSDQNVGIGGCVLADDTDIGAIGGGEYVKVWNIRNVRSPRLQAIFQTTGPVEDIAVSDDGSRVAALTGPPPDSPTADETLDVWSVSPTGATHELASLEVSGYMVYAQFIPHTHLLMYAPGGYSDIQPDVLNPDAGATYRSLCRTTQPILNRSLWDRHEKGLSYEPPC